MATVTLAQEHNSYIIYNRQVSTDSGWENPFRPGGDLSREADEIVERIKEGKPITPTPPANASPKLPGHDIVDADLTKTVANDLAHSPKATPNATNERNKPNQNANGNTVNNEKTKQAQKQPVGAVDVQRGTAGQPVDASQVEHVVIKKKPKCHCCVLQ